MFIFNKYNKSFIFKNNNKSYFYYNDISCNNINYNFSYKNNIIHSILFVISLNLYFYLFNHINYKNSFKSLIYFNSFLSFFISKKSLQKTI
jgi:hypothetical protein